jgi:Bacterial type II/III secretion system short domain
MKRFIGTLAALLLVAGSAFADEAAQGKSLLARTFQFKYKQAEKAATVIKQHMSAEGSMSIQPSTNALVVTDRPENIKQIAAALAAYDAPAQQFRIGVRLVYASKVAADQAPRVKDELKDVAAKLSVLRYNAFEDIGEALAEVREGAPGILEIDGYRAEFQLGEYDPTTDTVSVSGLKLARVGNAEVAQLLKTTLNVKLGQTLIMGATRQPQSQRALMIVITAKR